MSDQPTDGAAQRRQTAAHIFVTPSELDVDGVVSVDADTEHHLTRVLRLRDGELVSLSDGAGRWRLSTIAGSRGSFRLEPHSDVLVEARGYETLTLASAIPKGDRVDWLVQKATELGVDVVQLLHAERSVVRWRPERRAKQRDRLQRISDEAARQSRRVWRVEIVSPVEALDVLPAAAVAEPGGRPITSADRVIAIGPEGGWSADELAVAGDRIGLGPNVLRTETAGLAAMALSVANRH